MTRYLELIAIQRPFPYGVDERGRTLFSVNFEGIAEAPVDKFEEEIVKILTDAGLATLGVDTFIGPAASIPADSGPYISVIDTGGSATDFTHNDDGYEHLSLQLVVRGMSYAVARTRALAAWRALNGMRNFTVSV